MCSLLPLFWCLANGGFNVQVKKLLAYQPPWEKDHFAKSNFKGLDCLCPVIGNICIPSVEVNCAAYNKIGKRVQGMRDNPPLLLHTHVQSMTIVQVQKVGVAMELPVYTSRHV